ncbi:MAG: aminotransferase class V-fold PLP-dependent enzyme [Proteobacteria bacterium]|nr:aminotransferase class V-fold PLP-dependent enzyme [Pseudomonadota bacterium]MBU1714004.1 aminotransferase class V-fold PLP-dependent enzyme [Pseudomonadota bacterium]
MSRIYFDNNATTPVRSEVREAILPYLGDVFGNPSSAHRVGEEAKNGLDLAREQVAGLFKTRAARIVFTSGGSEANNIAIWSAVSADPAKKHIISSQVEHASVLEPLRFLAGYGYEIELLPVDSAGGLDLDRLSAALRPDTALVSLMGANNETGVLWPLAEISGICQGKNVLLHCDGVQMVGKESLDLEALGVDYFSVAGHKLHGPKGVGALYARRNVPVKPLIMGAGQEQGRRAGTENMPSIAGFGKACELAKQGLTEYSKIGALRDFLQQEIVKQIPDVIINGGTLPRLANTLNVSFKYCSSAGMIQELDARGVAVSGHSACHSGDLDPSHVLAAMRVPEDYLHGSLRISLSSCNTRQEADRFLALLPGIVARARQTFAA